MVFNMNLMAMTLMAGCRKHHHCVRQAHGVSLPEDGETFASPAPAMQRLLPLAADSCVHAACRRAVIGAGERRWPERRLYELLLPREAIGGSFRAGDRFSSTRPHGSEAITYPSIRSETLFRGSEASTFCVLPL